MYRILIVDDEEIVREGLRKNIAWKEKGIEVAATASNGIEGFECVRKYKPHIVLSDINMPLMDGLTMAEEIHKEFPLVKVVILTSYDDFSYARKALKSKVTEYILKYADYEEILNAVVKASNEYIAGKVLMEKALKGTPLMRSKFLADLVYGFGSSEMIENEAKLVGVRFDGSKFCAAVIKIEDFKSMTKNNNNNNSDLKLAVFTVLNICDETIAKYENCLAFADTNKYINIIFNFDDNDERVKEVIWSILNEVRENIENCSKITVSIGVGSIYSGFTSISTTYNEALTAIEMKNVRGNEPIVFIDKIKNSEDSHNAILQKIVEYIDKNFFKEELSLNDISNEVHISSAYISTLFKRYKQVNFSDYLIKMRIDKAIELLNNTDLKIYEVSEKVGYSNPQYFSVLFKKNTGYTPTEFKTLS